MSSVTSASSWSDPHVCPFCEASLTDPGAGFIDHIQANPACQAGFDTWRRNVADDMHGGWSG